MTEKNKSNYHLIAEEVATLVESKNKAYGNSFEVSGEFLKLLWPNGVPPEQYDQLLTLARVFDKCKRIATDKDALGENPWADILGYALLELEKEKRKKM